jgi:tetratricopeptide (TPR) repeat protein
MSYVRSGALVADHYQYFADVFLIALVSAGITMLWKRVRVVPRIAMTAVLVLLVGAMGVYAWNRAGMYRDEETLWRDNLARNPDAWQAHNRLGQIYFDAGKFNDALPHFDRAATLKPELADNRNQLGLVYTRLGRFEEGIVQYRDALRIKETQSTTAADHSATTIRTNLANTLTITANNLSGASSAMPTQAMQRYQEAIALYEQALIAEPMHPAVHRNLGMALIRLGRYDEAAMHLRKVLEVVPNEPNARELLQEIEQTKR